MRAEITPSGGSGGSQAVDKAQRLCRQRGCSLLQRTRLRETLARLQAEKCFFRGACPRKKRIGLIFRLPRRKTLRGFFVPKEFVYSLKAAALIRRGFSVSVLAESGKNACTSPCDMIKFHVTLNRGKLHKPGRTDRGMRVSNPGNTKLIMHPAVLNKIRIGGNK